VLNEDSCVWEAPVPKPENKIKLSGAAVQFFWDEPTLSWVEVA
jgi:hypothetical protein